MATRNHPLRRATASQPPPQFSGLFRRRKALEGRADMKSLGAENAVIVFGKRGCRMGHVVKHLLLCLGVNPADYVVEDRTRKLLQVNRRRLAAETQKIAGAVFIGGKLFDRLDRIMAAQITGELILILREAGALWL
ncbi:hypothetical protein Nepgr_012923 [Nepenthes gracilis]|uniref:Glutaredoxin domain-containing protein n=1 Tax=Nepenthes gracilis TaxID=150966 RepID=A0AAD3XN76_NEPGR|nr:hypothetical protein Nepgr_012923 [Nepenthes gracilis]